MQTEQIEVRPLTAVIGAQVDGIKLSEPMDDETFSFVHSALLEHLVLFFRDQEMTPDQHVALGKRFGPLHIHSSAPCIDNRPELMKIHADATSPFAEGTAWHTDVSCDEEPPMGSILHLTTVPKLGGDTLFANTAAAYQALSSGMKKMLDGVIGVYNSDHGYGGSRARAMTNIDGMKGAYQQAADVYESEHPIVRTHPESGLKGIYVGRGHTARFKDMTAQESEPLIRYLTDHITRPEFTCRFRWSVGAVAVWDNRITQHYAVNDYPGKRRHMRRVTLKGDRPQ